MVQFLRLFNQFVISFALNCTGCVSGLTDVEEEPESVAPPGLD